MCSTNRVEHPRRDVRARRVLLQLHLHPQRRPKGKSKILPPLFPTSQNRAGDGKERRDAAAVAEYLGGGELGQATQEALQLLQLHLHPRRSPSPLFRRERSTRRTPWSGSGGALAAGEARRRLETLAPLTPPSLLGPVRVGPPARLSWAGPSPHQY